MGVGAYMELTVYSGEYGILQFTHTHMHARIHTAHTQTNKHAHTYAHTVKVYMYDQDKHMNRSDLDIALGSQCTRLQQWLTVVDTASVHVQP